MNRAGIQLKERPEEIEEAIQSYIQDYSILCLHLRYERLDDKEAHTALFNFYLTGSDQAGEDHSLIYFQQLPQGLPALFQQLKAIAKEAGIRFQNTFEEDGYSIECQTIQRKIWRQK